MKAIAITNKGIEDVALNEINELIKVKGKPEDSVVIFSPKNYEDLCTVCYKSQSASRVLYLLNTFNVNNNLKKTQKQLQAAINKCKLKPWLIKDNTFKVLCEKTGNHDFSAQDVPAIAGELIIEKIKKQQGYEQKTNMNNPDVIVYVFINNDKGYIGIDFAGFDLGKRDYKIFSYAPSIKAPIAYSLIKLAGFDKNKTLLDPFCNEGVVTIEACFFATNKAVNYYRKNQLQFTNYKNLNIDFNEFFKKQDKKEENINQKIYCFTSQMRYLSGAKKNSKIAGVNKMLSFARVDIEWLDARISENEIDLIVSNAPRISKNTDSKEVEKIYNELFYQARYVLKPKGEVVLLSNNTKIIKENALKNGFKPVEERSVWQGKQELKICVFKK